MTTDELKALLTDCRNQIAYLHEKFAETGTGNSVIAQIDSALSSDFAVVPREPTMQIEAAYFLALEQSGTKNHYPVWKAMLAASEGK